MWAQTTSHQLWLLYKNHLIILRKSAPVILFPLGFKFMVVSGQLVLSSADTVWMSAWGEVTAAPHHLRGCCSSGTAAEERQWATQKAVMLIPALWIPSPARKIHQVLGRTEAELAFGSWQAACDGPVCLLSSLATASSPQQMLRSQNKHRFAIWDYCSAKQGAGQPLEQPVE